MPNTKNRFQIFKSSYLQVVGVLILIILAVLLVASFYVMGEVNAVNIGTLFLNAIKVSAIVFPLFAILNFTLHFRLLKKYISIYRK